MPHLNEVGRLPIPSDNCAIAIRDLPAGAPVQFADTSFRLSHHVLEGHRFAVRKIERGDQLTSWGQRFGIAARDIAAGEYVINEAVQVELSRRALDFPIPRAAELRQSDFGF